ncbi:hypothetical protein B0J12DRAFT_460429 [Macrophomina phaseolina]|uniref:Secreted protein n=1 Tax=Macrophomina phaseolina TaxID=35725 RepID=A0ABQ8FQG4_9PEZI|nr:hypothetical protein B0J12DRAFT_460429 [Macrophomina phaseolina]
MEAVLRARCLTMVMLTIRSQASHAAQDAGSGPCPAERYQICRHSMERRTPSRLRYSHSAHEPAPRALSQPPSFLVSGAAHGQTATSRRHSAPSTVSG